MLKKFTDGLIFGAGFGIALTGIMVAAIYILLPTITGNSVIPITAAPDNNFAPVDSIPPPQARYLGSTNISSGGFARSGVLARGAGKIIGTATVNGKPAKELRLRLGLNGSVYSQWATTDSTGKYIISVPYGEYLISGFELDKASADKSLPKMIAHPQNSYSSDAFSVSQSSNGQGLKFRFVKPVIKKIKRKEFKQDEEITLEWEDYPDASTYSVQIYEKDDPHTWSNETLFDWSERPMLLQSSINLSEYAITLKPGKFYKLQITAINKNKGRISKSAGDFRGYDFKVIR